MQLGHGIQSTLKLLGILSQINIKLKYRTAVLLQIFDSESSAIQTTPSSSLLHKSNEKWLDRVKIMLDLQASLFPRKKKAGCILNTALLKSPTDIIGHSQSRKRHAPFQAMANLLHRSIKAVQHWPFQNLAHPGLMNDLRYSTPPAHAHKPTCGCYSTYSIL